MFFFFAIKGAAAAAPLTPGENDVSHGCREILLYDSLLRQVADLIFPQPVACQNSAADGRRQAKDRFHECTLTRAVFPCDAEVVACKDLKAGFRFGGAVAGEVRAGVSRNCRQNLPPNKIFRRNFRRD